MQSYLQNCLIEFEERGTIFMLELIKQWIEEEETVDSLQQKLQYYRTRRDSFPKHSVDFQYYWSVTTYLQDLITHAPKQTEDYK